VQNKTIVLLALAAVATGTVLTYSAWPGDSGRSGPDVGLRVVASRASVEGGGDHGQAIARNGVGSREPVAPQAGLEEVDTLGGPSEKWQALQELLDAYERGTASRDELESALIDYARPLLYSRLDEERLEKRVDGVGRLPDMTARAALMGIEMGSQEREALAFLIDDNVDEIRRLATQAVTLAEECRLRKLDAGDYVIWGEGDPEPESTHQYTGSRPIFRGSGTTLLPGGFRLRMWLYSSDFPDLEAAFANVESAKTKAREELLGFLATLK